MDLEAFDLEQVAHPAMQAAHEAELALFQRLDGLLNRYAAGDSELAIDDLLAQLLRHSEAHFAGEERLMAAHPFPPAEAHAAEHRHALDGIRRAVDAWHQGRDPCALADAMLDKHLVWMRRHVATMDYLTAQFLVMAGRQAGG